jgi:DNA-binding transcriptional ArsR family regulator
MPNHSGRLDAVFRALADPTRRAVVERLCDGPAPVSDLAAPHDMALPSFLQHLKVLEGCGLVRSRKAGRVRTCRLVPLPLRSAESWMVQRRTTWQRRFDQLDAYLAELKRKENP